MTVKRQTSVAIHTGVAADPGDDTFYVDGCSAELIVDMKSQTGTSVAVDVVELVDGGWSLPYDAQTADFTVGATVTGYAYDGGRNATGVIVKDTDGGVTGTLVVKALQGHFKDNMILRDDNGTQGVAVLNSATGGSAVKTVGGTWATVTANSAAVFRAQFVNPLLTAGDGGFSKVTPREFALQYTFNAITNADFAVDIAQVM